MTKFKFSVKLMMTFISNNFIYIFLFLFAFQDVYKAQVFHRQVIQVKVHKVIQMTQTNAITFHFQIKTDCEWNLNWMKLSRRRGFTANEYCRLSLYSILNEWMWKLATISHDWAFCTHILPFLLNLDETIKRKSVFKRKWHIILFF